MKRLLILGAGQYGFVAKEIAEAMGIFEKIDFLDDNSEIAIGKLNEIEEVEYDAAFVAIGNPEVRNKWITKIQKLAALIHPNAVILPSAKIGEGSIVEAGAVICSNAEIGHGTIVMANAVVGHNAKVGTCCQLKYNCSVPERCIVPDGKKVECNTVWSQELQKEMIEEYNRKFLAEEERKNGVEPSFF